MGFQDSDFAARIKRVEVKSRRDAPMRGLRTVRDDSFDEQAMSRAILYPQLALVLGAVALVAGRAIAMNYLKIGPSADLLGLGEGCLVAALLFAIGMLFGKSNLIAHGALVIGASLAFFGEAYYIPVVPELMESIYNPEYVGRVLLYGR
ncbi:MAG: hypothetical protein ACTSVG_04605 [Alphaproteobacteria bacterium]